MGLSARTLFVICVTSACWAFSFGLGTQVVSRWLSALGISDTVIGLNHSFYYFGVAVGSCFVPMMTRRIGVAWCAALGMIFAGCTLAVFPWGGAEAGWYILRFVNGLASALALVPLETLVSRDSPSERKTQNFAWYGVSLTLGGALGIEMAPHLYDLDSTQVFLLGGLVPAFGAVLLLLGQYRRAPGTETPEVKTPLGWGRNFLSYGTAWGQGFLEGGLLAFLALFLVARGFSETEAGSLMSVTMIGVILFQVPVSRLADRYGKRPLLFLCYGVAIAGLLAIPWLSNPVVLAAGLFCFGACTGAMYPLGLALLSDRMPDSSLARAYAWYMVIECVGSVAGAAAMGRARDLWGEASMFAVGVAVLAAVIALALALRHAWPTEDLSAI